MKTILILISIGIIIIFTKHQSDMKKKAEHTKANKENEILTALQEAQEMLERLKTQFRFDNDHPISKVIEKNKNLLK